MSDSGRYFESIGRMASFRITSMTAAEAEEYFAAGEAALEALPGTFSEWLRSPYKDPVPPSIPPRDSLPDMYMRFGRWDDAARVIHRVAEIGLMTKDEEKERLAWVAGCKAAAIAALDLVRDRPGILQKDVYRELPYINRECLKWFLRFSREIDRVKRGDSNRLYLPGLAPSEADSEAPGLGQESALPAPSDIQFPRWHVSLSFGESKAAAYPQAVALARMAPQYREEAVEGRLMHQAVYSHKPDEYLQFVKLYELVQGWKSVFVIINGQVVDRKIVGGLNYCYGDRCRSGNPDFCFGASPMTENPFGCHRLQISRMNHPWWSFGYLDKQGVWHVDKPAILARMTEHSLPYRLCPAFSWERATTALDRLPDSIDPRSLKDWTTRRAATPWHEDPDELAGRLRAWLDDPQSQPDIEEWYTGRASGTFAGHPQPAGGTPRVGSGSGPSQPTRKAPGCLLCAVALLAVLTALVSAAT